VTLQQDMMAWLTQGAIADRAVEHLGASDRGVMLYRKVFEECSRMVEAGEDPLFVYRDASRAERIDIPIDTVESAKTGAGRRLGRGQTPNLVLAASQANTKVDIEALVAQMRSGQNRWNPVTEEVIELRLASLRKRGVA
jgi:hypothetical protein